MRIKSLETANDFSIQRLLAWSLPIFGFTALTAFCAHAKIYLPFTPVPITLQSMAVVLSGAVLGSSRGLISQMLLILVGALGMPVFTTDASGLNVILGSTGGYILGFMLCAYISGVMAEKSKLKNFGSGSLYLFIASFFIFVPGVIWLKGLLGISWKSALELGLYPFIIGDILKTFVAASVIWSLAKIKQR